MQKPVSNFVVSFRDSSTTINDMVPTSLTSNDEKESIGKGENNRVKFPLKIPQPNTTQEGFQRFHNISSDSQEDIVSSASIGTKVNSSNRSSNGENKLNDMIDNLDESLVEVDGENKLPLTGYRKLINQSRKFIVHLMEQPNFHYIIIILIMVDLIIVFIELVLAQLSLPCLTEEEMIAYNATAQRPECLLLPTDATENGELALYYISLIIISIFVIEILTAFYAFGWRRYKKAIYLIDAIVVFASFILEVYFHFGTLGKVGRVAAGIVVLRLWKIIRAIHAIAHSMSLRNHIIIEHIEEAKQIINDEKINAEKTIHQQQIKIQHLIKLLTKNKKQINQSNRLRANSLDDINFV